MEEDGNMELKQLDINEFYREENAYYTKDGMSVPEGLGSLILITPKQTIGVYNVPGLDNSKEMVDGLGGHGETLDEVLASIYNVSLEKLGYKRDKQLNDIIYGRGLNFIVITLINEINLRSAVIEIPKVISKYQYDSLVSLSKIFKSLGITAMGNISLYNPLLGNYDKSDNKALFKTYETLNADVLEALKEQVIPDDKYQIKNQKYEERPYLYKEQNKSFRR